MNTARPMQGAHHYTGLADKRGGASRYLIQLVAALRRSIGRICSSATRLRGTRDKKDRAKFHRPIGFVYPGELSADRERAALVFSLCAMCAPFVFFLVGCVIAAKWFG